jgi:hypothetical protein
LILHRGRDNARKKLENSRAAVKRASWTAFLQRNSSIAKMLDNTRNGRPLCDQVSGDVDIKTDKA